MTSPVQSPGTDLQLWLSDYLYAETLHSLGSYQYACENLARLQKDLKKRGAEAMATDAGPAVSALAQAVNASLECNRNLRSRLHRSPDVERRNHLSSRRPSPFSNEQEQEGKGEFEPDADLLRQIATFYRDSEAALQLYRADRDAAKGSDSPGAKLGAKLSFIHDPQRRGSSSAPQPNALIDGKIGRTRDRLDKIEALLGKTARSDTSTGHDDSGRGDRFHALLESHVAGRNPILPAIVQAFNDAHMWMHKAENTLAWGFGEMFTETPQNHAKAERMLRYAYALNTFVFVAGRAMCWIFAEDEVERRHVVEDYENCCDRLAPTYCTWISAQFSLLALHRRAFTSWTRGEPDVAYRDYHKLTRLLRGLRRPAQKRGLRVPGTETFLEGMTAMSELHIGRIYRGQHAYRMALRYFERASRHARGWEDDAEIGQLLKSSHWRVNLLLNEGKANFELGHHKRSILQYSKAWRAFLLLVQSETHATANVDVVNDFIEWLEPVVDDPEMSRIELRDRIEPLVEQFVTLRTPIHLRLLAADIVMRMGHLIFILRLPHRPSEKTLDGRGEQRHHQLASECVEQALFLDPASTLAASDVLNIVEAREELEAQARAKGEGPPVPRGESPAESAVRLSQSVVPLRDQWPSGGGSFEDAARITELTLQQWLASTLRPPGDGLEPEQSPEQRVAQGLLRSFLTHTDSSNMKLAQVYGYLMRTRRDLMRTRRPKPRPEVGRHALDFVCLRRYSSFFPFLPRPAAFRASGGGYLVQVHEPGPVAPFGIAIDPGPDFIENLYACGYSIADLDMIVLTHDHADHIASVDALLALMGIRRDLGDPTFNQEKKRCLTIVGNESVRRRYEYFGESHPVKLDKPDSREKAPRSDAVRVLDFDEIAEITAQDDTDRSKAVEDAEILLRPRRLRIEPVRTWGHTDANGYPAQGFLLRAGPPGGEASILFSGDTGSPLQEERRTGRRPRQELYAKGERDLLAAVEEADIVVAHLSAVPLKELRQLSNLDTDAGKTLSSVREYLELWEAAAAQAEFKSPDHDEREGIRRTKFLLNQIQFGFRSLPDNGEDFSVSPFTELKLLRKQSERHLYLTGLIEIAKRMADSRGRAKLLLIGELREELGTFRTQIARRVRDAFFDGGTDAEGPSALTADVGLRVRLSRPEGPSIAHSSILCSTCDLDNDLLDTERYHPPQEIHELCVKGEDEAVFYNCSLHDPRHQEGDYWVESVGRYNVFGD
jgi:glyoxylase-like metal-dependent hydrolase (beta-lactamase superfamily II)